MEYTIGARVRRAFTAMSDPSMAATFGGRMVDRVDNVLATLAKLGTEGTALRQVRILLSMQTEKFRSYLKLILQRWLLTMLERKVHRELEHTSS